MANRQEMGDPFSPRGLHGEPHNTQDQDLFTPDHARDTIEVVPSSNEAESVYDATPAEPSRSYKGLACKDHAQEVAKKFTKCHKIKVDEKQRDWAAWLYWSRGNALGHEDFPSVEKTIFKDAEKLPFFEQTYCFRAAVLFVGVLSAVCQGWYQSVIASTAQYMINDFGLIVNNPTLPPCGPNPEPKTLGCSVNKDLWILGGLASAPSLAAGVLGLLLSDPFQNHLLGRRRTIMAAAFLSILATILLLFVNNPAGVIGLRSLIGFSLGMKASVIPPFLSEISPLHLRGKVLAVWQLGDAFGILVGFILWVVVDKAPFEHTAGPDGSTRLSDRAKWKVLSILPLISTVPLLFTALVIPESPIFLLKIREYNKALDSAVEYAPNSLHGLTHFLGFHFEMATETREGETQRRKEERKKKKKNRHISKNQSTNGEQSSIQLHPEQANAKHQPPKLLLGECEDRKSKAKRREKLASQQNNLRRRKASVRTEKSAQEEADLESNGAAAGDDSSASSTDDDLPARIRTLGEDVVNLFHRRKERCPHDYHMQRRHFFHRLFKLFHDPRCFMATLSCALVMVAQASCSINAFAFFATPLVENGIREGAAMWFALAFGAVTFFVGLLVLALTDRHGRTTLLLSGLPWLVLFSFILGAVFTISNKDARTAAVIVIALCFTGVYSFTLGPAAFSLAAESYPASVREVGMAFCVFSNMITLGLQLLVYPFITAWVGYSNSFFIYGAINVVALMLCFLFTVDTQDQLLDELQSTFELPISMHCRYRITNVLPKAPRAFWINLTGYLGFAARLFRGKPPTVCDDIELFHEWASDMPSGWAERRERKKARKLEKMEAAGNGAGSSES